MNPTKGKYIHIRTHRRGKEGRREGEEEGEKREREEERRNKSTLKGKVFAYEAKKHNTVKFHLLILKFQKYQKKGQIYCKWWTNR